MSGYPLARAGLALLVLGALAALGFSLDVASGGDCRVSATGTVAGSARIPVYIPAGEYLVERGLIFGLGDVIYVEDPAPGAYTGTATPSVDCRGEALLTQARLEVSVAADSPSIPSFTVSVNYSEGRAVVEFSQVTAPTPQATAWPLSKASYRVVEGEGVAVAGAVVERFEEEGVYVLTATLLLDPGDPALLSPVEVEVSLTGEARWLHVSGSGRGTCLERVTVDEPTVKTVQAPVSLHLSESGSCGCTRINAEALSATLASLSIALLGAAAALYASTRSGRGVGGA